MNQRLQNLSEQSISEAIEANIREFLLALGRLGGGEERDEPAIQWIIGGAPISYHNCVVRATLTAETMDEVILASMRCLQAHNVPGSWHVGPSMSPPHLGEQLIVHGFTQGGGEPGMAVDLLAIPDQVSMPSGLVIERVQDEQELQVWTHTLGMGFGEGEIEANWVGAMYRRAGLGDQSTRSGWDLLCLDASLSTTARDWGGDHFGSLAGCPQTWLSIRDSQFILHGILSLPAPGLPGILYNRTV